MPTNKEFLLQYKEHVVRATHLDGDFVFNLSDTIKVLHTVSGTPLGCIPDDLWIEALGHSSNGIDSPEVLDFIRWMEVEADIIRWADEDEAPDVE